MKIHIILIQRMCLQNKMPENDFISPLMTNDFNYWFRQL